MTKMFKGKRIDKFILVKEVGIGNWSFVYLAEYREENSKEIQYAACKIIPKEKIIGQKKDQLIQGIKNHQIIHHPNVVQLMDIFTDDEYIYLFIELCECSIFDFTISRGKIKEEDAAFYFKQVLTGLKYIHSINIAHCDLRPEHILLDLNGNVKITDFIFSDIIDNAYHYDKKYACFASPELINERKCDKKLSDIWSCGVILYFITTGSLPWSNNEDFQSQIKAGEYKIPSFLSEKCADLIRKLMNVDPSKRITIDEALNHPLLKDIDVYPFALNHCYVPIEKIEDLFESGKNHHKEGKIISKSHKENKHHHKKHEDDSKHKNELDEVNMKYMSKSRRESKSSDDKNNSKHNRKSDEIKLESSSRSRKNSKNNLKLNHNDKFEIVDSTSRNTTKSKILNDFDYDSDEIMMSQKSLESEFEKMAEKNRSNNKHLCMIKHCLETD